MNLKKELRSVGYDLIDSPIRNHKPLQFWLKKPSNSVELYYEHICHALSSGEVPNIIEDNALSVNYQREQDYKFNIGITVLDELFTALGLGNLGLNSEFRQGKRVTLSYNSSKILSVANGELSDFLSRADFNHPNRDFMRNANRGNIIVISGVLTAKDIRATIETNTAIHADLQAKLKQVTAGKIAFTLLSEHIIEMKSEGNASFPIAIKANRIDWDKGDFSKMTLMTDNRTWF